MDRKGHLHTEPESDKIAFFVLFSFCDSVTLCRINTLSYCSYYSVSFRSDCEKSSRFHRSINVLEYSTAASTMHICTVQWMLHPWINFLNNAQPRSTASRIISTMPAFSFVSPWSEKSCSLLLLFVASRVLFQF